MMYYELEAAALVSPSRLHQYNSLLSECGLKNEDDTDYTVLAVEGENIIACGSLKGNILKQIAVSRAAEAGGVCAAIVSALVSEAYRRGYSQQFLFTKPQHKRLFSSLSFFPIACTETVLMMENRPNGVDAFLRGIQKHEGRNGSVVCHCNPLTNGHKCLLEYAAAHSDWLYVFVVSEDSAMFPFETRLKFVKEATSKLKNVSVISGGPYIVSKATFPTYFIKDEASADLAWCDIDLELFSNRITTPLGIVKRFVGEEPFCPVTNRYNQRMKAILPQHGIEVIEIPRFNEISATKVRSLINEGLIESIKSLVPNDVYEYCQNRFTTDA